MYNYLLKFCIYTLILLVLSNCKLFTSNNDDINNINNEDSNIELNNIQFSDCSESEYIIKLQKFNSNGLQIIHSMSEFCCGTESLDVQLLNNNDSILIEETDLGPYTYCFCNHEVSYTLDQLQNDNTYYFTILESINSYDRDTINFELLFSDYIDTTIYYKNNNY